MLQEDVAITVGHSIVVVGDNIMKRRKAMTKKEIFAYLVKIGMMTPAAADRILGDEEE